MQFKSRNQCNKKLKISFRSSKQDLFIFFFSVIAIFAYLIVYGVACSGTNPQSKNHETSNQSNLNKQSTQLNNQAQSWNGVWVGQGCQKSGAKDCWSIRISLQNENAAISGFIEYPSLNCKAQLEFVKWENGTVVFRERHGQKGVCADGGWLRLTHRSTPNELDFEWAFPNGRVDARAIVMLESPQSTQSDTITISKKYEDPKPTRKVTLQELQRSCDDGDASACNSLLQELQRSCDDGNASACNSLGGVYADGKGITKDLAKAATFYQKACALGVSDSASACFNLGNAYANGEGVEQDKTKAVTFIQKGETLYQNSCNNKDALACLILGRIYFDGDGVKKDVSKGIELYHKACNAGMGFACDELQRLSKEAIFGPSNRR